ncbi:porin family protein [Candidatus Aminicenantes bacterium AC-335-A11]|jgi:outer membrane protein W|nr:porin family protein [SCandidatus Aminicenantes bacterium Aminicenantia_JdfR_composite]MCP2597695.1 porin family protein [Candidatus Aminicenantes bacterium AC-335-G13]MCP2618416.1 porin family protein [Candidatus Aminicenantes bacterium AC-335-A11]MCP2620723.1 porin family protein [Candidatus Aminicenantes bacterium AC-334-E05]
MKIKNTLLYRKLFVLFLILFISFPIYAQTRRHQFTLFGGFNHVFEYGSEEDYILGENDFPVTPSHTPPVFGLSYSFFFFKNLGLELDFRYILNSKLTLRDPSDDDTIKIDSNKHYSFTGNLIFQLLSGKFRPYIIVGAGFDTLVNVEDQTLTSEYGFPVFLKAPEKTTDFVGNIGGGILYFFGSSFGTRIDSRYIFIPKTNEHPAISNFDVTMGIFFRF